MPEEHESLEEFLTHLRHVFAYKYAKTLLANRHSVVEIGCGEGYGTRVLSETCERVVGFDVSEEAVNHANSKYSNDRCEFRLYDGSRLPVADGDFDAAVSFQVIEHVHADANFVREAYRVIKDNGLLIVTTPNRLHRLKAGQKPWNGYHVREYDSDGLAELLGVEVSNVTMSGIEGNEEIQRVELERVRRIRQVISFDPFNLRRVLPRALMRRLANAVRKRIFREGDRGPELAEWKKRYGVSDFRVVDSPRYETLDLLAVCRK